MITRQSSLLISSKHSYNQFEQSECKIKIGESEIRCSESAKNLGVVFDKFMTMEKFVNGKCQSAMYSFRCISKVRKCLDIDTTRTLIQSLVISKLDYANSALYAVNTSYLKKLQIVQNPAARVITKVKRRDHITPVLYNLHLLPVEKRLKFKVLMMFFKCLNELVPKYLSGLLIPYKPGRALLNRQNTLTCQKNSSRVGDQCFSVYGPLLWNSLYTYTA